MSTIVAVDIISNTDYVLDNNRLEFKLNNLERASGVIFSFSSLYLISKLNIRRNRNTLTILIFIQLDDLVNSMDSYLSKLVKSKKSIYKLIVYRDNSMKFRIFLRTYINLVNSKSSVS